jgi:hypothetical protein
MSMIADQVLEQVTETADEQASQITSHDRHPSPERPPFARLQLSNRRAWAIGAAAAIALIAAACTALFNYAPLNKEHPLGLMQSDALSARFAPAANQAAAPQPRALAAKSAAVMQNGLLDATRAPAPNPQTPMIARTASLTILVSNFAAARSSLDPILARFGGYSASLIVSTPEHGQRHFQASLRIPAGQLDSALNDLKKLGRTLNESQSGEEVTQQHADLVARLQNSRETEQRLRAILEQRTGKIQDVLQVEEEIARVRGEIESMESEQKTLEHRVTFATVDLQLVEEYKESFNSSPVSTSGRLRNAFVNGMRNATGIVIGLILFVEEFGPVILIWLAILALPAWLAWRRYRSHQNAS